MLAHLGVQNLRRSSNSSFSISAARKALIERQFFAIPHYDSNILSAQFYVAALKAHPNIPSEIAAGGFSTLHTWLREHLYQQGRKFKPDELVERTTGGPISTKPYLAYLRAKYGELCQLPSGERVRQ